MNLINKYKDSKYSELCEYFCEITDELDKLAGIKTRAGSGWRHYILADNFCIKNSRLAIRIPGGTVGSITIDNENVITGILVDTNYVVKTYQLDVNEKLKKFIGCKIDNLN